MSKHQAGRADPKSLYDSMKKGGVQRRANMPHEQGGKGVGETTEKGERDSKCSVGMKGFKCKQKPSRGETLFIYARLLLYMLSSRSETVPHESRLPLPENHTPLWGRREKKNMPENMRLPVTGTPIAGLHMKGCRFLVPCRDREHPLVGQ